ncbi:hypothetical protein C2W64_04119 [Brevibacillus laterosporus]|nr:CD1375 family protein [Brevibacillus laterosporus]RAP29172.1 hypothetical protein C2W64_04119 [Brevibacillus laterosporus]
MNPFAKIYCDLICAGLKVLNDVPMKVRSDVEKILAEK